jgi:hypothetical protein
VTSVGAYPAPPGTKHGRGPGRTTRYGGGVNGPIAARRTPVAVLALATALVLGGCGDDQAEDDPGAAAPSGSTSTSPSPSESATASESVSESASASASTPAVAPASGPPMQIEGVALNLPAGWEISVPGDRSEAGYAPGNSGGIVTIVGGPADPSESVDFNAGHALKTAKRDGLDAQRLDNRTVGGVEGWVVAGTSKRLPLQYQFGTVTGGNSVTVAIRWISPPPADAQAIIDSILATVTYPASAS